MSYTAKQARRALRYRQRAYHNLESFAAYVPIPGVPKESDTDREFEVVETPLAKHHKLTLRILQAMVEGTLVYTKELQTPDFSTFIAEAPTPKNPRPLPPPPGGKAKLGVGGKIADLDEIILTLDEIATKEEGIDSEGREIKGLSGQTWVKYGTVDSCSNPATKASASGKSSAQSETQSIASTPIDASDTERNAGPTDSQITSPQSEPWFPLKYEVAHAIGRDGNEDINLAYEISKALGIHVNVCKRVMLMMPPGSAKSTYASVVFPAWVMGKYPTSEVILTGYGDVICKRHGKRARQLVGTPAYKGIFSETLDPNTRAADDWMTTNSSSYKSAGILSGITGFRADGLIWDDLTKGRKEADSETIRDDTHNAYLDDARSRKKPDAWEVGIGTRWHEDEIMGRILPEGYAGESGFMECRDGNVWYVICLPAQAERHDDPLGREKGEFLWPEWFHEGYWAEKKINPRSWGSLYQQRPAPEEGIYFKKDWFKEYTNLPEEVDYYIAYDPAVTDEEDVSVADDTVIQVWAVDSNARIYLVDEWVRKTTIDVWARQLVEMVKIYKPIEVISESGVIRRAAEPYIKREMRQAKTFFNTEWVTRSANKQAMSRGYQGMCSAGQVYFPATSVGQDNIDELVRFPAGKEDNRVDAGTNFCLRLEEIWEANPPEHDKSEDRGIIGGEGIPIKSLMPERFPKKKPDYWARKRYH